MRRFGEFIEYQFAVAAMEVRIGSGVLRYVLGGSWLFTFVGEVHDCTFRFTSILHLLRLAIPFNW